MVWIKSWAGRRGIPTIVLCAVLSLQGGWTGEASTTPMLSDRQAGELQRIANDFPDVLGGVWADPETHVLTVDLPAASQTSGSRRNEANQRLATVGTRSDIEFSSMPKKWIVRFSSVGPTLAVLNALNARVRTAQPWAKDVGRELVSWYVDPRLHEVVIGLSRITPMLVSDAANAFGSLIQLTIAQPAILQGCCNRLWDGQPYSGSDRLSSTDGNQCSAGYAAYQVIGGVTHYGMLTAGHCWGIGTTVPQAWFDPNGGYHATGNMGKVTDQVWGNYSSDAEFLDATTIGTRVADDLWYGPQPNPTGYAWVYGAGTSFVGASVCMDGSFTGENCHGVVDAVNVCVQITNGFYECYQDRAHSNNGSVLTQGGDSGGPVIYPYGGGFDVYGTITAKQSDNSEYWYSDASSELSLLGVILWHV